MLSADISILTVSVESSAVKCPWSVSHWHINSRVQATKDALGCLFFGFRLFSLPFGCQAEVTLVAFLECLSLGIPSCNTKPGGE